MNNGFVDLNSDIFAITGAKCCPMVGISGAMLPNAYVSDVEKWKTVIRLAKKLGDSYWDECPAVGELVFIRAGGYTYCYVTNLYGDLESQGFTTNGIHKRAMA